MNARPPTRSRRTAAHNVRTDDTVAPSRLQQILNLISAIVAPLTLITALMFYVGWIRTSELFTYFGVDAALLRFSNQDYLLRSVEGLWGPLVVLLAVGIACSIGHSILRQCLLAGAVDEIRRHARTGMWVGLAAALTGAVEIVLPGRLPLPTIVHPLCLGVGVAVASYSLWVWRSLEQAPDGRPAVLARPATGLTVLVCLLVVAAMFWAADEYARGVGNGLAQDFGDGLGKRPAVTVFSEKRLFLDAGSTPETTLVPPGGDPDARFRFRYDGLRLLSVSGDRMVLLPDRWNDGQGRAILLVLDTGVRIELAPGS